MSEGSLQAPTRHPLNWQDPDFTDPEKIDAELRRQFDVCHGCRRCFNLCDSFPRLFDLIDESESGELDTVSSDDFKPVVDACTMCDMCFMTKCPYVPPHDFAIDFPHLMLRYRAMEHAQGKTSFAQKQLAQMDRNGKLAKLASSVVNWGAKKDNGLTRPMMEKIAHIDPRAELPVFHGKTFTARAKTPIEVNKQAPAYGKRKAVIYATCNVNYNSPDVGDKARALLAHNGVETEVIYPACCGMPYLEQGDLAKVAQQAEKVSAALLPYVEQGYDVINLTASCGLMMKFEWPLILPDHQGLKTLAAAAYDICEYIVDVSKKDGLAEGLRPLDGGISVHHACHARAQNMGAKSAEMLRLIPDASVDLVERCSGHGGTFGVLEPTYDLAVKVARPTVRTIKGKENPHLVSDCPLAAKHLHQILNEADDTLVPPSSYRHPIEVFAAAFGL